MPNLPPRRYQLDPTGSNPDNLVIGEVRELQNRPIRVAGSTYGPFYTASAVVYDDADSRVLVHGVDYIFGELQAQITRAYNKEAAILVIIKNPAVSSKIRLDIQVVGGDFQQNFENIIAMYEDLANDTRPVLWDNVAMKPVYYPPSPHTQPLSTIFGFEALVQALENVRQAIILGNVPAFERLLQLFEGLGLTIPEFDVALKKKGYVTLEVLEHAARVMNFNQLDVTPYRQFVIPGKNYLFNFSSMRVNDGTRYYWTIEHKGTSIFDFYQVQGSFVVNQNAGSFILPVAIAEQDGTGRFDLVVRNGAPTGVEVFRIKDILMRKVVLAKSRRLSAVTRRCCFTTPGMARTAKAYAYLRSVKRHDIQR